MGTEISRASDEDRQRYLDHIDNLYGDGYIQTPTEAETLRRQILEARSVSTLNSTLSGMPLPPMPRQRRDWGVPERFVPLVIGMGLVGALVAAVPTTALAHHGDSLSNSLSAAFFVTGALIFAASIITACCAFASWDNIGQFERDRRREADRNRKNQSR
jgi:hypothetical protein